MAKQQTILLIEDEEAIRSGLIDVFLYHGYQIEACAEGTEGLQLALSGRYDLILLDVMLPGIDGFEICERIRQHDASQAVIMLTAKNSDEEIIHGLRLGADDYVSKPFSVAQLVLRVQAVLRRSSTSDEPPRSLFLGEKGAVELAIDTQNLSARGALGEIRFTRREIELISYLAAHTARPVAREELLAEVWGYGKELEIETRTVDIHIAKIRRKIERDAKKPRHLITVRGAGYRLRTLQQGDGATRPDSEQGDSIAP